MQKIIINDWVSIRYNFFFLLLAVDVADMVIFIYMLHTSFHFIFFQRNLTALTPIDNFLTETTIL